jgi:ABC-type nitrate/sulfonate/bicarbonate transport system substrate-binding protein
LRSVAIVGLVHAQVDRLTNGTEWTVLSINTDYPLFWILSRPEIESVEQLRGRRIACHPVGAGPRAWVRVILRQAGLDPDRDVTLVPRFPGDYTQDLIRLGRGDIDAAFVGSAVLPEVVAPRHDLRILVTVGDQFRIPTTGIAVDRSIHEPDDEGLVAMAEAHRAALHVIKTEADTAARLIRGVVPSLTEDEAGLYYTKYVEPHFTDDGRYHGSGWERSLSLVADELGVVNDIPLRSLYPAGGDSV